MHHDQTRKYMFPNNPRNGKVKANPKMHKQDKEWVESLETYIKDTTHFLHMLNNDLKTLPHEAILFTMDVKALYPSVPRKEGLHYNVVYPAPRSQPALCRSNLLHFIHKSTV